jgi:3-oxoacyl-[acyl-carrier-protein] synthase III
MTQAYSRIYGSGFVTGEVAVDNDTLAKVFETSDEWIRERSGIQQRYFVKEGTTTSDLGFGAAKKALEDANVKPDEIDYIVVATMTPDYYFPGVGPQLQAKLGLGHIPTLDIRQQCSGFVYGLQVCDALIRSGAAKRLLFVGCEIHSGFFPFTPKAWDIVMGRSNEALSPEEMASNSQHRHLLVLFGDAAGAVVMGPTDDPKRGILGFSLHTDGRTLDSLYTPGVGFAARPYVSQAQLDEHKFVPHMEGKTVFKMAVTKMPEAVQAVCAKAGVQVNDLNLLIPHQANLRISEGVQKQLKLPDEKVYNNIQRYGNTTAATIPIAYDECKKSGRIKQGDLVCFVGLGAGFHWGSALMRE